MEKHLENDKTSKFYTSLGKWTYDPIYGSVGPTHDM